MPDPRSTRPSPRSTRPANRPSRRHEILTAAIELLAVQPPDQIAVSDIAAQAGMTPAAFYYHFASKDEILDEIIAEFAGDWSRLVGGLLPELTSIGATSTGEALRKKTRDDLSKRAAKSFLVMNPAKDRIDSAVAGLGLITLLEVISRARLELDPSYRTLGPMRFRASAATLAEHLVK